MASRLQLTRQNLNENKKSKNEIESKTLKHIMNQIMNNKLYVQPICSNMLLNLVSKAIQQSKRNKKLQQLIKGQTYEKSIQFTQQYCYGILDRFIRQNKNKPDNFQQQQLLIPVGAEFAFLNHNQLNNDTVKQQIAIDKKNNRSIKRTSKRNSSFNINKVFVIKRQSNFNSYSKTQNNNNNINELKHISFNEINNNDTTKVTNNLTQQMIKTETRKFSINPLIKDQTNDKKQHNLMSNQSLGTKRTFQSNKTNKQNKLIKLQSDDEQQTKLTKQNNQQKSKNQNKPFQQQQYINFLRSRKFKLQNMMKDFDEHQLIKNNNKNNYLQVPLSKQNTIQNTINKRNVINTDYNGNVIQMKNKNIQHIYGNSINNNGQNNNLAENNKQKIIISKQQINNNSYKKKHYQQDSLNNFQKTLMEKVNFNVKDYHDDVNNIFNQIFSSIKTAQLAKTNINKKGKSQKNTQNMKDKQNRNTNQSSALPSLNTLKSNIKKDQHNQNTKHKKVVMINNDDKQNNINQKFKQQASNRKSHQKIQIQQAQKQMKISEHKGQIVSPRGYRYRKSIKLKNQIFSQKDLKKNKLLNQNHKKQTDKNRKYTFDDNQSVSSSDSEHQKQKKGTNKQLIQSQQEQKKKKLFSFLSFFMSKAPI